MCAKMSFCLSRMYGINAMHWIACVKSEWMWSWSQIEECKHLWFYLQRMLSYCFCYVFMPSGYLFKFVKGEAFTQALRTSQCW